MEEWWEQFAYLRTRTTMAVHINWTGVMPEWGFPLDNVTAAALMIHGMMHMRTKVETGQYEVENMRGQPLDMHQFLRVFGMTRVANEGADQLVQVSDSRHIALLRDGAVVVVPIYDAAGQPLSVPQLKAQLCATLALVDTSQLEDQAAEYGALSRDGSAEGSRCNTSLLTGLDRDVWASQRALLLSDSTSAESLRMVESAICCVAFDRASPSSKEEVARLCLGGHCRDRWFDKSFTTVIFENGRCGVNAEHTPVDAMTMVSLFINTLDGLRETLTHSRPTCLAPPPPRNPKVAPPRMLRWRLQTSTREAIETASVELVSLASDCEILHLDFAHYGKGFIKRCKLHPDFYMQMALQLTMWRLHAVCCATYETGHTRAFYHGRTDTIRTASIESAAFCSAMESATASAEEKIAALKAACNAHAEQVQRVLTGQGIDRHLLGLYIAGRLNGLDPLPAIFSDKSFQASGGGGNYRLSTSNVGYTPLFGGFAPMTADGYGTCYAQLEGRMNVVISAWRSCQETSAGKFRDTLARTLCDLRAVCLSASGGANAKL
mmetsp:Transcript_77960/g.154932  ORF Transcript_77960/g.154932 Transcript_77960/m.154932 type:complete len:549 (-) Transcript_77960:374-2020(-)